ncbi:hypothetical protein [Streptomyces sp. CC224B]|uniref:hypothetical protein n=1 Tax=Streptomyces sp. CC224B TaxID=3044571 RepID=UPI0024A92082|nr:hypothetical protein [Streptomyces sp. CC224B]
MVEPDERSWAEAIGAYESGRRIIKVTRREHEDWALDVHTLMRGDTPDARGWAVLDSYDAEDEFDRLDDPFYPFTLLPDDTEKAAELRLRLREIPRSSAKRFLVVLTTLGLNFARDPDFEERRPGLEEQVDVILSRFPEGSRFYVNTGPEDAAMDYYQQVPGCCPLTDYDWELGMILVSETEVGMVWAFLPL